MLDSIVFSESGAGTATIANDIKLVIPNSAPFTWGNVGNNGNVTFEGSDIDKAGKPNSDGSRILTINVTKDFDSSDVLIISDLKILLIMVQKLFLQ